MDAGLAALDQRRNGGRVSANAQMRSQLLNSDIGNIDITKEQALNAKNKGQAMGPPVVPIQAQQYYNSGVHQGYGYGPGSQTMQNVPPPHNQYNYPGENSRKSSMASSSASFSNFFKGKYKRLNHKRNSGPVGIENDDDDNLDINEHESSFLTFNDITTIRNNGGHAYGYGGHQDDTSPIIPTLVTAGNGPNLNNTEYRKHMMNQKKMTLSSLAKQQQLQLQQQHQQMAQPYNSGMAGPDGPRTMSLQTYHQRPMVMPGGRPIVGPPVPVGAQQPRMGMGMGPHPPAGGRFNSMMSGNGPSPMTGRQIHPAQNGIPGADPRAMSLTADRRPAGPLTANAQARNMNPYHGNYTGPAIGPNVGPGSRNIQKQPSPQSYPHPNIGVPPVTSAAAETNAGPRAMSLQSYTPQPFYRQDVRGTISQDADFNNRSQGAKTLAPPPAQHTRSAGKGTSGSNSSYTSTNSVISGKITEHSSPTTPSNTSSDEQHNIPALPRSPLKYQLHKTVSTGDEDTDNEKGHVNSKEYDEDQSTFSQEKAVSKEEENFDTDSLVKLNILTLSESARRALENDEQRTSYANKDKAQTEKHEAQSNESDLAINLEPSTALVSNVPMDMTPVVKLEGFDQSSTTQRTEPKEEVVSPTKPKPSSRTQSSQKINRISSSESSISKDSRKSSTNFQKAKSFFMKIKRTKSSDQRAVSSSSSSNRNSKAEESEIQQDTFRAKTPNPNDKHRRSYHSLFSASSAGTALDGPIAAKESAYDRSSSTLHIRRSMIIEESTQLQEEPDTEKAQVLSGIHTQHTLYTSSYASNKDSRSSLLISSDDLNLLKQNRALMQELKLVSMELAESIVRETRLENELRSQTSKDVDATPALSLQDFETELRKKSSKIVELIQQLNEERLRRFIAEEQNVLCQHGANPSTTEMSLKINQLQDELESKNQQLEHYKRQSRTSESNS